MKWSKEQEQAITSFGKNVLVNAGAGSGKTAVLTEHVTHLLKSDIKLERLLVLTFTDLASSEMKIRIRKRLAETNEYKELSQLVDSSHIQTFDAFSLHLVEKYHHVLNLSKDISVIDGTILDIEKHRIIDAIFDENYKKQDQVFVKLINTYSLKQDDQIKDFVIKIYDSASLSIDEEAFYQSITSEYFDAKHIDFVINQRFLELRETFEIVKRSVADKLENTIDIDNITLAMDNLLSYKTYDELYSALQAFSFPTKPRSEPKDGIVRDKIKEYFASICSRSSANFGYASDIKNNIESTKDFSILLVLLARELGKRLWNFKIKNNRFSFNDIAKLALQLLRDDKTKEEIKNSFDYILVDEYQDTSDIQEEVIKSLGRDNVFMVGDVKQSIYRFRNANCQIFQDKYNLYKSNSGGEKIDMNENFRSREEVINDLNTFFSVFMNSGNNIINYSLDHMVKCGDITYKNSRVENQQYGIGIINYDENGLSNDAKGELEAEIVAKDIIDKINSKYQVSDKKDGIRYLRPCRFSDFTIIIDRSKDFDNYKTIFTKHHIPLFTYSDEEVTTSDVVNVIKNLLKMLDCAINNNYEDGTYKHAFLSVGRSFICELGDEYLYKTVKFNSIKESKIALIIESLKEELRTKTLEEIIKILIDKFDIYHSLFKLGDYSANAHKVESLLSLAKAMDDIGMSLDNVVSYFEDVEKYEIKIGLSPVVDVEDSVKLMTIHKSKGLEFPICYFPGLFRSFNRQDTKTTFLVSSKYGIILPPYEGEFISLTKHLAKIDENRNDFEEKLRLFYVALTRVKENAILIDYSNEEEPSPIDLPLAKSFHSFLKFVSFRNGMVKQYQKTDVELIDTDKKGETTQSSLIIKSIEMAKDKIETRRPSMISVSEDQNQYVALGTKIHYLLEIANYETKDTNFIKDSKLRKCVDRVLNDELFNGINNSNLRHEFEFFDEENGVNGIIDCLIIRQNQVDIVDFKLKNINKEEYIDQVNAYRNYISKLTSLPVRAYLLAVVTGEKEEVYE